MLNSNRTETITLLDPNTNSLGIVGTYKILLRMDGRKEGMREEGRPERWKEEEHT